MARDKNSRLTLAGRGVDEPARDESAEDEAGKLDKQREDSGRGAGEEGAEGGAGEKSKSFPVQLGHPKASILIWEHCKVELDKMQAEFARSKDPKIEAIRITAATVPTPSAPASYDTGHGGMLVKTGDKFSVRLSNGLIINSLKD